MIPMTNEELSNITGLIELSVGDNPRRIKRMVNAFTLLYIVEKQDDTPEDAHFGSVCWQASACAQAFEKLYHQLIRHEDILYEDVWTSAYRKNCPHQKGTAGDKEATENQEVPNKLELCLTEAGLWKMNGRKTALSSAGFLKLSGTKRAGIFSGNASAFLPSPMRIQRLTKVRNGRRSL